MKTLSIIINGQFTVRRMTGQERFAYELLLAWDNMELPSDISMKLVVPSNAMNIPQLNNIEVVKYGKAYGSLWEQLCFTFYMLTHRGISLNLCSIMPVLYPGIICIHDLSYKVNPQYFTTPYSKVSQWWHIFQYKLASKFSPLVLTVSEYSKRQMVEIYNYNPKKICVVGNGWEHFERIKSDETLLTRKPELFEKPYFFSLGSLAPNKNIKWILEVAKKHPQYKFLVAGNANPKAYGNEYVNIEDSNVKFLGYISDGEIKELMKHCKAFIFPSIFEGFGIPPLEALSVGAKIIVAHSSCLPEIFEYSAYYIDPLKYDVDLDKLLLSSVSDSTKILHKYRFTRFAKQILEEIRRINNSR